MGVNLYGLASFPIDQQSDLDHLERRLGSQFHRCPYPLRLLAYSTCFSMQTAITTLAQREHPLTALALHARPVMEAAEAAVAGRCPLTAPLAPLCAMPARQRATLAHAISDTPLLHTALETLATSNASVAVADRDLAAIWALTVDELGRTLWVIPWIREQLRFYETLEHGHLRRVAYALIAWVGDDERPETLQTTLQHTLQREVTQLDVLPPLLRCDYREQRWSLAPTVPGEPHYTALLAYDARGAWDGLTLHRLLSLTSDVAIAVDVQTVRHGKAMRTAELAYRAATAVMRDVTVKDSRAERLLHDAETVMHQLPSESLHNVQIAVLVGAESEATLATNVAEVRGLMGSNLSLTRLPNVQGELVKYWSTTPARAIDAPMKPRNMTSHGVGCCLAVTGYHMATNTTGVLWGIDAMRRSPIFYNLFQHNQAAHMVVLGKSGYGKTFYFNTITARAAALEGYRVIGIDAFRNGERIEAALGTTGARCHRLGPETAFNLMDVVYDAMTEGGWRRMQNPHVAGQVALFLGKPATIINPTTGTSTLTLIPRDLEPGEEGVLDRALNDIYADVDPAWPAHAMPILSDLIDVLERIMEPEAKVLAELLRLKLFGSRTSRVPTALGRQFNAHTTVDWDFSRDVNFYDFSRVSPRLWSFCYAQAVGAINRYMRDPQRDLSRHTLLLIDEYHYVARVEAVARLAAEICKVARKYKLALMAADQNPSTFLGSDTGRFIFENAVAKILFHLDDMPARQMAEAISDLHQGHVDFLTHATIGQALGIFGNDVYLMNNEVNPLEERWFQGS